MELKEIKQEDYLNFRENWLRPIRKNTNNHLPFLKEIDDQTREEINNKLFFLQERFRKIEDSQIINEKLRQCLSYLVELKLTTLNGDQKKSKMITKHLLKDDYFNLKMIINEVKSFSACLKDLSAEYLEINNLVEQKCSLEESVHFSNLPHKKYLLRLQETAQKQEVLVKELGKQFVSLVQQTQLKRG